MRDSTKQNLKTLANAISDEYLIPQVLNSNEFVEIACCLAEDMGMSLSRQSIIRYESDLKLMCHYRKGEHYQDLEEDIKIVEEKPTKELKLTINLYKDGSYEFIKPEVKPLGIRIPDYSMFAEGEDGLIILKGTYKGKTIEEIDGVAGFEGASVGWAKWCLKADKDLTEDDRNVFNKIITKLI